MEVLLVTGSSRGIGAEICRLAAADGWKVCINYTSSADEADALVHEIRQQGHCHCTAGQRCQRKRSGGVIRTH